MYRSSVSLKTLLKFITQEQKKKTSKSRKTEGKEQRKRKINVQNDKIYLKQRIKDLNIIRLNLKWCHDTSLLEFWVMISSVMWARWLANRFIHVMLWWNLSSFNCNWIRIASIDLKMRVSTWTISCCVCDLIRWFLVCNLIEFLNCMIQSDQAILICSTWADWMGWLEVWCTGLRVALLKRLDGQGYMYVVTGLVCSHCSCIIAMEGGVLKRRDGQGHIVTGLVLFVLLTHHCDGGSLVSATCWHKVRFSIFKGALMQFDNTIYLSIFTPCCPLHRAVHYAILSCTLY